LTPLHIAAKSGNTELVRYLVLSGADVDEYNQVNSFTSSSVSVQLASVTAENRSTDHGSNSMSHTV